jgi:hypothetical protein
MRILPAEARPPKKAIARRHSPPAYTGNLGYQAFRACLRWEFGFTCPLCLLHEADLTGGLGTSGLGVMTIEHQVPKGAMVGWRNRYANCLYACRWCNQARGAKPNKTKAGCLLDPTAVGWGAHFLMSKGDLVARKGDARAAYTHEAYDLNDPRKVDRRRHRRDLISERRALLTEGPRSIAALLRFVARHPLDPFVKTALHMAAQLRLELTRAARDLRRFAAVPDDAPTGCRCVSAAALDLPRHAAAGCWELA